MRYGAGVKEVVAATIERNQPGSYQLTIDEAPSALGGDAQGGLSESEVAEALSQVLADTFTLYFKAHTFHWNVMGPMFHTLHLMFEEQYNELWLAGDVIAERFRPYRRGGFGNSFMRTALLQRALSV